MIEQLWIWCVLYSPSCIQNLFVVAGEMLSVAAPFLEHQMHPTVIIGAFRQALEDLIEVLRDVVSVPVDINDKKEMTRIIKSCIGTKLVTKWYVPIMLVIIKTF